MPLDRIKSGIVTNEDLQRQHMEIIDMLKSYFSDVINKQTEIITKLDDIKDLLDKIEDDIIILSSNQSVISDKIDDIESKIKKVRELLDQLQFLRPGI